MRDLTFHVLASDDGMFLLEANVWGDFLEVYDCYSISSTETIPDDLKGKKLYAEVIDFACFVLGLDHDDVYLTDEDETKILYA